jgi:competence protein ComEC
MLLIFVVAAARPAAQAASGKLTVHFLDVGQGDAALVVFPEGATMLVDAGGDINFQSNGEGEVEFKNDFSVGEAVVSRFLWSQGRDRLDYALATHGHADHAGGFYDIVKNFHVGQAIVGNAPALGDEFNRLAESFAARKIPVGRVTAGKRFELQRVTIEVLWPQHSASQTATSDNDDSIVLRLVYGSISMLLTGDIEKASEDALLVSGVNLKADVLKVPHHGSKTSSTEAFIKAVQPQCVVISVGERSRFGHPSQAVINRYREIGARIFQTGRDGTVTVETDGTTINISTHRNKVAPMIFQSPAGQ